MFNYWGLEANEVTDLNTGPRYLFRSGLYFIDPVFSCSSKCPKPAGVIPLGTELCDTCHITRICFGF